MDAINNIKNILFDNDKDQNTTSAEKENYGQTQEGNPQDIQHLNSDLDNIDYIISTFFRITIFIILIDTQLYDIEEFESIYLNYVDAVNSTALTTQQKLCLKLREDNIQENYCRRWKVEVSDIHLKSVKDESTDVFLLFDFGSNLKEFKVKVHNSEPK